MYKKNVSRFARLPVSVLIGAMFLGGCAVAPKPLMDAEVTKRVQADQARIYTSQEQVVRPITFNDAVARSLKYNLDYRLKLTESALSAGLLEVAKYDMLPDLTVAAGYTARNNLAGSQSFTINPDGTTTDTNSYSGGVEKHRRTYNIDLSWSILDFGLGYYTAKQKADEVLIAEERKRSVVQNILKDVRSSYWRAVGAQRLTKDAEALTERVKSALERSRAAENEGLMPPKDALNYQRMLLDAMSLLSSRRQELDLAKRELAALMNITPGSDFTLAEEAEPALSPAPLNVAELEEMALLNRPELRQEDYKSRITAAEARKQLLYLLPNLSLNITPQYDSNKYLYNNNWVEASSRVSWNLLKALSYGDTKEAQKAQINVDDMRRMALSMAVLTQVRVAIERYQMALRDLEIAKETSQVDQRMATYARAAQNTRADTELELIRAETRAVNSEFQRYAAYATAQAAFGRIYSALGLEVVPPGTENASVEELGSKVASFVSDIEKSTFVHFEAPAPKARPLTLRFEPADEAALSEDAKAAIANGVSKALRRNDINLVEGGDDAFALSMKLQLQPVHNGTRRADWLLVLRDASGKELGNTRYSSVLPSQPSDKTITAFAEAAAISNLRNINNWMKSVK